MAKNETVKTTETVKGTDVLSAIPAETLAALRASIEAEIIEKRKNAFNESADAREAEEDLRKVDGMIIRAGEILDTLKKGRKAGKDAETLCKVAKLFSSVGQSAYLFLNPPTRSGGTRGRKGSALPVW